MENDVVRTSGENTLVDLWLEGRFRSITVLRSAIEVYLRASQEEAALMTALDRREFVRTHLGLIGRAATTLLQTNSEADGITIGAGELRHQRSTSEIQLAA
jgi:hypothetical protein